MVYTKNNTPKSSNKRLSQPRGRASGWGRTKINRTLYSSTKETENTEMKVDNVVENFTTILPQPMPSEDRWNSKMFELCHY